nr:hypothetical protein [Tanacetum cinerariifolium]
MQDMLPRVRFTVLILLGLTVTNSSQVPIECRTTVNSSVLYSSSGLSMSWRAGIGRSCTSKHAEVYYECMEPFKSLLCLWIRSRSIAAIWLEKVVTPLIEPAIKNSKESPSQGFAAAPAVLKPERLKVDKTRYE